MAIFGSIVAALFTFEPIIPGLMFLAIFAGMIFYEDIMVHLIRFYANRISPYGRPAWEIFSATFQPGVNIEISYFW